MNGLTCMNTFILYDLTYTYFEEEIKNSKIARFDRNKEKLSNAKFIVLVIIVNLNVTL